jgi:hypothetical protein
LIAEVQSSNDVAHFTMDDREPLVTACQRGLGVVLVRIRFDDSLPMGDGGLVPRARANEVPLRLEQRTDGSFRK